MNYTELVALLQEYMQNSSTDFVAAIPEIVALAEDQIYQTAQITALKKNATLTLTDNVKYITFPTDFLGAYYASVTSDGYSNPILEKDVSFIAEAYPLVLYRGVPQYYAIYDDTSFVVAPTPDDAYALDLHYFYKPESIVTAGTSWLGDNTESVLFYGCMVEAYRYMKGDGEMMAVYEKAYMAALSRLKTLGEGYNKRDNFRIDMPRVVPT